MYVWVGFRHLIALEEAPGSGKATDWSKVRETFDDCLLTASLQSATDFFAVFQTHVGQRHREAVEQVCPSVLSFSRN